MVLGGLDFGKRPAHDGTLSTKSEHSEYSHGYFEYHAGTRVLTWALLVLTYGNLSTHMDTGSDRTRYTEQFHVVLSVPSRRDASDGTVAFTLAPH